MEDKDVEKVREEIRAEFDKEYEARLQEERKRLEEDNKKTIEEALAQWRKEQTPPTQEELSQLLNQEYAEFKVVLPWGSETKEFTISELPIAAEKKFYKLIKDKLIPRIKDFNLINLPEANNVEEKIR